MTTQATTGECTARANRQRAHEPSGRWQLGLGLALITVGFWSTLPAALKIALDVLDIWTLTWLRFVVAAALTLLWLGLRGQLGAFRRLDRLGWGLLALAAVGLIGNYLGYLASLDYTNPATAQVLIQLAPLFLALGGLVLFGERFNRWQWLGFVAIWIGLSVFLLGRWPATADSGTRDLLLGAGLMVLSAASWAAYALAQKQALVQLSAQSIMGFIYAVGALVLLPSVSAFSPASWSALQLAIVIYCCLNTLAAYSSFAEALNHWGASRVSAVLAITPIGTIVFGLAIEPWASAWLPPDRLSALAWFGAAMVVLGSATTALAGRRKRA